MTLVTSVTYVLLLLFPVSQQVGMKDNIATEQECYKYAVKASRIAAINRVPMKWKCFRSDDPKLKAILNAVKNHGLDT